jgi:hypothetical protein
MGEVGTTQVPISRSMSSESLMRSRRCEIALLSSKVGKNKKEKSMREMRVKKKV